MRYLLDTNTCIAAMRNHVTVVTRLATISPRDCAVSSITSFELLTGVEKCSHPAQERAKVETLLRTLTELGFDSPAAQASARIRAALETQGIPIGPYDLLLAGQAVVAGLVMVTNNVQEFSRVPGLQIENWQAAPPQNP
jgi:tRNA(fMet)-specific endonuclease VapC